MTMSHQYKESVFQILEEGKERLDDGSIKVSLSPKDLTYHLRT